jgi:hypothetical protein
VNEDVVVRESGFHWDGSTVYYVFTAGNDAEGLSYEEVSYHVDFYDSEGKPVAGDDGRFAIMWPDDTLATAGLVAASEQPVKMEVSFASGEGVEVAEKRGFSIGEGRFEATEFGGRVIALIENPYDEDLSDLSVTAVLTDEDGTMMTGGTQTLLLLQAGGKAVVTIPIIGKAPAAPAEVAVYTTFSPLTLELLR